MAKKISSLSVVLGATAAPFVNAFSKAGAMADALRSKVTDVGSTIFKLTGIGAVVGAAFGALRGIGSGIGLAAELEQTEVAFTTMLGSADAAKAMMGQLSTFAASTPFEFPGIASAAKSLLAFGVSAGDIPNTLRMVGDVAAGVGVNLEDLAQIYGKAKTSGKLMAEDINQLTGRGIPIIKELAKQFGVSEGEVKGLVTAGQVGFPQLQKAFESMTGKGGQFAGLMEAQSKTLGGLWSTLTDNIGMALAGLVRTIVDAFGLRDALAAFTTFIGDAGTMINNAVARWAPVIVQLAAGAWNSIVGVWSQIWGFVGPIITQIVNWISNNWQAIFANVASRAAAIWGVVSGAFWGIWDIIVNVGSAVMSAWDSAMNFLGFKAQEASATTGSTMETIGSWLLWVGEVANNALVVVGFALRNFGDIIRFTGITAIYWLVRTANQVAYVFTEVIPGMLSWAWNNWRDIFKTVGSFTAAVFTNMATNVGNFFKGIWSWMKGDGFQFDWTPLTDGFAVAIKEMPKIAEREAGPLEQGLAQEADRLGESLKTGLDEAFNKNDQIGKDAAKAVKNGFEQLKPPEIPDPTPPQLHIETKPAEDGLAKVEDKAKKTAKSISDTGNILFGSAEQMARMASARTYGGSTAATAKPTSAPSSAAASAARDAGRAATAASSGSTDNPLLTYLKQVLPTIVKAVKDGAVELVQEA